MQQKKITIIFVLFAIIIASASFSAFKEFSEIQKADFTPEAEINILQGVGGNDCLLPSYEQTKISCRQERTTSCLLAFLLKNNELFGVVSFMLLLFNARDFCLLRLRNTLYPFHGFW